MTRGPLEAAVDRALRQAAPRAVGALTRRYGDFGSAEDAVQEALLAALVHWPESGVPENPGGWLFQVARRRLLDRLESDEARRRREIAFAERSGDRDAPKDEEADGMAKDETLELLFLCCTPALTAPSAIALTLRAVGGLTTAEIAGAFLVPEATMAQRIVRAKETIRSSGARFELPDPAERDDRLGGVRHVLYLMFNEGYTGSSGADLVRVELADEAIRLTRLLRRTTSNDPETAGLLALMILTHARRHARSGPRGELIPLDEQDRSLWDRAAIDEGTSLIRRVFASGAIGAYQIQAAVAALHDAAPSTEATDWPQIVELYAALEKIAPNPLVTLNRAVAVAMVSGPAAGLAMIAKLESDRRLAETHRLDAVRGHLLEMSGDRAAAVLAYQAAARRTLSIPERNYLLLKAARLA